jgi:mono/diheme cytochrome c family protein
MLTRSLLLVAAFFGWCNIACGSEPFEAFLEKHCVRCHGPQKEEGDIRFDKLSRDFKSGTETHNWAETLDKVNSGEMPPFRVCYES